MAEKGFTQALLRRTTPSLVARTTVRQPAVRITEGDRSSYLTLSKGTVIAPVFFTVERCLIPVVFRTGTGSLVQETVTGTAQCGVRIINLNLIRVNIFRFNFDRTCGSGLTLQKS